MHELPLAQALATEHCGLASPGVTHKPDWHTLAVEQVQQSSLVWHWLRHTALMHACPPLQSAFAEQPGVLPWLAWHVPFRHSS
jgi:hypothetical protein